MTSLNHLGFVRQIHSIKGIAAHLVKAIDQPFEELLEVAHLLVDVGDALRLHTLHLENLLYRLLGIAWILLALCWQLLLHLQVLAHHSFVHLRDGHISNTFHKILTADLVKQHSACGDVGGFLLS